MRNEVLIRNLNILITEHGSQEALAFAIKLEEINQRSISDIRLGRRSLTKEQMREIEKKLLIPAGCLIGMRSVARGFCLE